MWDLVCFVSPCEIVLAQPPCITSAHPCWRYLWMRLEFSRVIATTTTSPPSATTRRELLRCKFWGKGDGRQRAERGGVGPGVRRGECREWICCDGATDQRAHDRCDRNIFRARGILLPGTCFTTLCCCPRRAGGYGG